MMVAFAASVFMFLAIATGAIALLGPNGRSRNVAEERLWKLRKSKSDTADGTAGPSLKRSHSSIPTLQRLLGESKWAVTTARDLQRANVQLRVSEYLLLRLLLASAGFLVTALLLQFNPLGLLLGVLAAVVAYVIPRFYLKMLRERRLAKIEKQLVEFLPMLASSLRSGFAFQQGVELAAQQLEPPLADELAVLLNDANLGSTMEEALLEMGRRVGSTDLDMMITAVLVQRGSGGNLSEILDKAGMTLRERERIHGELQTLTASARLTGFILSAYPIAVGLLLLLIMPSLWSVMFTDTVGRVFLGVALSLQLLGFLVMRRVMKIEF